MTVPKHVVVDLPVLRTMKVVKNRRKNAETIRLHGTIPLPVRVLAKGEAEPFEIRMESTAPRFEGLRGLSVDGIPHVDARETIRSLHTLEEPVDVVDEETGERPPTARYAGFGEDGWGDPASFGIFSLGADDLPRGVMDRTEMQLYRALLPEAEGHHGAVDAAGFDATGMEILSDDRERAEASAVRTAASLVFSDRGLFSSGIEPVVSRYMIAARDGTISPSDGFLTARHVGSWRREIGRGLILLGMGNAGAMGPGPMPVGIPFRRGPWAFQDAEAEIQKIHDELTIHRRVSLGPCRREADEFEELADACWRGPLPAEAVLRAAELVAAIAKRAGMDDPQEREGGEWGMSSRILRAMAAYRNGGCA